MDVAISGRRISVTDANRDAVIERLTESIAKLKDRVIRAEVEFTATEAKGDPDQAVRCEITLRGKGPVVRATGLAEDKMIAFDRAADKLIAQLRRAADRRKAHRGLRLEDLPLDFSAMTAQPAASTAEPNADEVPTRSVAGLDVTGEGPLVVREKTFSSEPLTLAQALDEMELVGHDFFLFVDRDTKMPSVVYRRKAYDYGVIHLQSAE